MDPLTDPTAHGGTESDALDLVIPSMPGYGFSRQADHDGLGLHPDSTRLGDADKRTRIYAICGARRRLGISCYGTKGRAGGYQLGLRPQTLYGIADSPVGLPAHFVDHDAWSYALISRVFAAEATGLTRDDVLDNITIAWLTKTAISGARLYWK